MIYFSNLINEFINELVFSFSFLLLFASFFYFIKFTISRKKKEKKNAPDNFSSFHFNGNGKSNIK